MKTDSRKKGVLEKLKEDILKIEKEKEKESQKEWDGNPEEEIVKKDRLLKDKESEIKRLETSCQDQEDIWFQKIADLKTERKNKKEEEEQRQKQQVEVVQLEERWKMLCEEHDDIMDEVKKEGEDKTIDVWMVEVALEELQKNWTKTERQLRRFSAVNLEADDEFKEVEQRYIALKESYDDLEASQKSLVTLRTQLKEEAKTLFLQSFEKIALCFSEYFSALFDGGRATITLIGEGDPLEREIAIDVTLPGKKKKEMYALSGGEKTLVTLALLLSLFKVKKGAFCILDEIDAPLDDQNVRRFTKFLNHLRDKFQFVMITHNKVSMKNADYLYGVTMATPGVSSVLAINADQYRKEKVSI